VARERLVKPPAKIPVKDTETERALDEVRRAVNDLMNDPYIKGRDLDVTLPDGIEVLVKHGLGRKFTGYSLSAPIGAVTTGRIVEGLPDADRLTIYLTANGYGADVIVRMRVW
jgi:hypothetical protein